VIPAGYDGEVDSRRDKPTCRPGPKRPVRPRSMPVVRRESRHRRSGGGPRHRRPSRQSRAGTGAAAGGWLGAI